MNIDLLKRLCCAYGVSGNEDDVRNIIIEEIKDFADEIKVDNSGNIIVFKKGKNRATVKLMLSAHMDEVGFIITHITDEGLLKFSTIGGIDTRVICGKSVIIGKEHINGVIGAKPIHLLKSNQKEEAVPIDELYIDIGASSKQEALEYVSLGDFAYFYSIFDSSNGMIKAKAIDDRAGCLILIDMIKSDLEFDMFFTFVVQEEIGLRGAKTAAYQVNPDSAIVVESTTAADIPGVSKDKQVCQIGKGAVISFMDKSTIYDREYYNLAINIANKNNIAVQPKQAVAGGNDAGAIHVSRGGVRTLAVSLPCRYLHSPTSLISQSDFNSAKLIVWECANKIASGDYE